MSDQPEVTEPTIGVKMYTALKIADEMINKAEAIDAKNRPDADVYTKEDISQHLNWILAEMLDHFDSNGYTVNRIIEKNE